VAADVREKVKAKLLERGLEMFVKYEYKSGRSDGFVVVYRDNQGNEFDSGNWHLSKTWLGKTLMEKPLAKGEDVLNLKPEFIPHS
jgi:hypothetical protein